MSIYDAPLQSSFKYTGLNKFIDCVVSVLYLQVEHCLTLIGTRQGTFHPFVLFGSDFVSWIFIKKLQTFIKWKLTSIGLIWHPPGKLIKMPLGGPKEKHFSYSCPLGLIQWNCQVQLSFCETSKANSAILCKFVCTG